MTKPRGRPPIYTTDEERRAAKAAQTRKSNSTFCTIGIDFEVRDQMNALADRLAENFGFRPTMSQTLRWLLKKGEAS